MPNETQTSRDHPPVLSPAERLDSWKEIAAYLKHSVRTVKRWETEGLPVRRHPHTRKSAIYAYKPEIDIWWNDGRARLAVAGNGKRATVLVLTIVIVTGLLGTLGWKIVRGRRTALRSALQIKSLAVLPLSSLSGEPDQEYFADGMTEELTTDLGKISALRVISRTSAMQYKGTKKSLADIARELNVDAVVEGTVARSGSHLRITANLLQSFPEKHL